MTYYFIDKKNMMRKSGEITAKIESCYESFYSFKDILEGLKSDPLAKFMYLQGRAGLDDKLVKKLAKAVEEMRKIYFEIQIDISQCSLDEFFTNGKKEGKEDE